MNKRNFENGITLVALIITIIILIILVAVAVKSILDYNIINLAFNSVEKYAKAQGEEEDMFNEIYDKYSKILVADNDDAVIGNITVKDLKTLIQEKVDEAIKDIKPAKKEILYSSGQTLSGVREINFNDTGKNLSDYDFVIVYSKCFTQYTSLIFDTSETLTFNTFYTYIEGIVFQLLH